MPERIQRRRTKGWTMPPGAVYVGRPTRWGNTWPVGDIVSDGGPRYYGRRYAYLDAAAATAVFRCWALGTVADTPDAKDFRAKVLAELAGRDLACWCPLDQPCHADVLLEIANQPAQTGAPA